MSTNDVKTTPEQPPKAPKQTAVYVSNLPDDVTVDELQGHFSKVGVIMDDMFTGGPRIKLYENSDGSLKGDALVVYLCEPSVQLAIDILDESQLRPGRLIRVNSASFKPSGEDREDNSEEDEAAGPAAKHRKIDKETWKKQMREMKRKIAWNADEEEGVVEAQAVDPAEKARQDKLAKIVVLKHLFTPDELKADPAASLDIKEDILLESEKFGPVTSVHVFEDSEEGKCAVKFTSKEAASDCIAAFEGRYFGGQRISAELYDGSFKLRGHVQKQDGDAEARLERFAEWLEEHPEDEADSANVKS